MRKKPKIRQLYNEAKEDGIDYLLTNNLDVLNKTIDEFKANGKGDLAITNLLKEITNLNRWKASQSYCLNITIMLRNYNFLMLIISP
jgi:hypothetical protein